MFWIEAMGIAMVPILLIWCHILDREQRAGDEHVKACSDPDYFKTRDQLLKENAELRAELYIEKHKTEYR